ncbi:MAG: ATP-binding protein, partial [Pacificibacter sp.]
TARNAAFLRILRLPDGSKKVVSFVEWLHQGRFAEAAQHIDLRHDLRGHCELVSSDGQVLEMRASKLPDDGRVWLLADVTERRKMSDRVQQIDRIETLGKVAGDTAHDFATILSTIRTHAHLLEARGHDDEHESLYAIGNAVDFGASLTDRLLAFARKQSLTPELVDLNALIEGVIDLVEIGLKPNVQLDVSLPETSLQVRVDPGQLESALLNLLLNANNAVSDSGHIKVSLDQYEADQARILVVDDGHGMPLEVLDRAIEPFFTTREGEGGTGLGLSIVYGFIRQTGGYLNIESNVARGTQIEVLLPLAGADHEPHHLPFANACLLVEDDHRTRASVCQLLEGLGYDITVSETGEDALALLQQQCFDLLVSDLDLGGDIDGLELVERAWSAPHKVRTIIMSGKSSAKKVVPDYTAFIEKPVTCSALSAILERVKHI